MPIHPENIGQQFVYHGSSVDNLDSILHHGAQPEWGEGDWGEGFYVSGEEGLAQEFAGYRSYPEPDDVDERSHAGVLRGTVHAENPRHFKDHDEVYKYLESKGKADDDYATENMSDLMKADGHDYFDVGDPSRRGHIGVALKGGIFRPDAVKETEEPGYTNDWTGEPERDWQRKWTDLR